LFLPPELRPLPPPLVPDRLALEPLRENARSVWVPLEALAKALDPGPWVVAVAFTPLGDAVAVALAVLVPELEKDVAELVKPVPVTVPLMLTLALAVAPGVLDLVVRFVWARPGSAATRGANAANARMRGTRMETPDNGILCHR